MAENAENKEANINAHGFFYHMSMKGRFMAVQLPIIILALAACIGISEYYLYNSVKQTLKLSISDSTERVSRRVSSFLATNRNSAVDLAEWVAITDRTKLAQSVLRDAAARNDFARVVITDKN